MSTAPTRQPASIHRQRGIITAMAAVILIAAVLYVLTQSFGIIGKTSLSNQSQNESIAAFFLAESGVERVQAEIKTALDGSSYSDTYCTTTLASMPAESLGRGTFQYTPAPYCTCNGSGCVAPNCTECNVTVKGTVDSAARSLRVQISIVNENGTQGCGATPTMPVQSLEPNAGVFSTLGYRSKIGNCTGGGGSGAAVEICEIYDPSDKVGTLRDCKADIVNQGWDVESSGLNNVSNMGVYSAMPTASPAWLNIDHTLDEPGVGISPAIRNYAEIGLLFYPDPLAAPSAIVYRGSYGWQTGANKTTGTSQDGGSLPAGWTCNPANGTTANMSNAAAADTLIYGFSSMTNQLSDVSFGQTSTTTTINSVNYLQSQQLYMRKIVTVEGTQGDGLYTQTWFAYNPGYYSPTGATSGGADFTGATGGVVRVDAATNSTTLIVNSVSGGSRYGELRVGDIITGTTPATAIASGSGGTGTYTVNPPVTVAGNTEITVSSKILRVEQIYSGSINATDIIYSGITGSTSTIMSGPGGIGDYELNAHVAPVKSANQNMLSSNTKITLPIGATLPAVGTAVAVSAGTGRFDLADVYGIISGNTLTITNVINGSLKVGDALFGTFVQPNTRISAFDGTGTGGPGTYSVCRTIAGNTCAAQSGAAGPMVARAAVVSIGTGNFVASRYPRSSAGGLSGSAQICGGVCAFFFDGNGSQTNFNLFPTLGGIDWASGFSCLSGVDSSQIKILGRSGTRRTSWTEVVQ